MTPSAPDQTGSPPLDFFDSSPFQIFSSTATARSGARGFSLNSTSPGKIALRETHLNSGTRGVRNSGTSTSPLKV